jgi:hypothetical protein
MQTEYDDTALIKPHFCDVTPSCVRFQKSFCLKTSDLMMEAACPSKTLIRSYLNTRRRIPKHSNLHSHSSQTIQPRKHWTRPITFHLDQYSWELSGSCTVLQVGGSRDRSPVVSLGIFFPKLPTEPCALGSTQPLKMCKHGRCVRVTTLPLS